MPLTSVLDLLQLCICHKESPTDSTVTGCPLRLSDWQNHLFHHRIMPIFFSLLDIRRVIPKKLPNQRPLMAFSDLIILLCNPTSSWLGSIHLHSLRLEGQSSSDTQIPTWQRHCILDKRAMIASFLVGQISSIRSQGESCRITKIV